MDTRQCLHERLSKRKRRRYILFVLCIIGMIVCFVLTPTFGRRIYSLWALLSGWAFLIVLYADACADRVIREVTEYLEQRLKHHGNDE